MGMVVRTNTMALNAYRQLGMNNSAVAKSLEKLSSGFRINRAGDDAAGLAISEKMKAQITGLETASSNAQDGISLIQTAEGNLTEVHSMLNRMVELATKSANGTYTQTERDALQDEVDALLDEIDRISQSANFNGTNLLDGTMGLNKGAFTVGDAGAVEATPAPNVTNKLTIPTKKAAGAPTYPTDKYHLTVAGNDQENPSVTVDLRDYSIKGTGTANDKGKVKIEVAGFTVETADIDVENDVTTEDIVDALITKINTETAVDADGNKVLTNNGMYFKAEKVGTTGIKFSYAGLAANTTNAAATDKFTEAQANTINGVFGSALTITDPAKGTAQGMEVHATVDVDWAKEEKAGAPAGMDIGLTADVVKAGATLTIDGKTFKFVDADGKTVDELGDDEIGIWSADASAKQIEKAVEQLSHKDTTNFDIAAIDGTNIHIEQKVDSKGVYDTYDKLVAVISAKGPATSAGTELTIAADKINSGDAIRIGDVTYTFVDEKTGSGENQIELGTKGADAVANLKKALDDNKALDYTEAGGKFTIRSADAKADAPFIIGGGLTLQIGDTADSFNKMNVSVANMSAKGLGLDGLKITSESLASNAIDKIKTAINTVSTARAGMGALQNRLEHTINNLDVAVENLSAANSRIRDTDMAKEMMNYTKMNVLVQSAQAMLAQANQQPQSVLQLLQ